MTNAEFSNTFTTLLNSYNTQAQFGQQASQREIVLDEYEKSVLLTQAQDIIVKSYFDGTLNQQGQGFDDSTRRQIDFSSLIKVANLDLSNSNVSVKFDTRGSLYKLPSVTPTNSSTTEVLFILNEKLVIKKFLLTSTTTGSVKVTISTDGEYVVIPINYKEYDREMSKPYAQPLKKQAWRLFQNSNQGFDVQTELIIKQATKDLLKSHNQDVVLEGSDPLSSTLEDQVDYTTNTLVVSSVTPTPTVNSYELRPIYRIRYIKRPNPIILEDLPNNLDIDGVNTAEECELNPIIHMDILNKAVELAITTRGGSYLQPQQRQQQQQQ